MIRPLLAAAIVFVCGGTVSSQATLTVGGGPGTFATIQAAVDAAAPGDAILIEPGSRAGATVTKGVYLLGSASGTVTLTTELTIRAVPAGEHVVVKNVTAVNRIGCRDCRGSVHFERVESRGGVCSGSCTLVGGVGLIVARCDHVSALDCTFDARVVSSLPPGARIDASVGISVIDSAMHLTRCQALGVGIPYSAGHPPGSTPTNTAGMVAVGSRLVFVDSTLAGGPELSCPSAPFCATFAQPALYATGGSIVTKGSTFTGGAFLTPYYGPNATGIFANGGTEIVQDPATPILIGGGTVTLQPLHDLQTRGVAPGSTASITLRVNAQAALPYATFAAFPGMPFYNAPGIWLDPASTVPLFAGVVRGTVTDVGFIPAFFPRGLPVALQGYVVNAGRLELTTPATLVLH